MSVVMQLSERLEIWTGCTLSIVIWKSKIIFSEKLYKEGLICIIIHNTALQKKILKYTNDEYVFLAAEYESDVRFASWRLDLSVLQLWNFALLLKSKKKSSVSDIKL